MGCAESSTTSAQALPDSEKSITQLEASLGYKNLDAKQVVQTFKTYQVKEQLSSQQFKQAMGELGIDVTQLSALDSIQSQFYRHFQEHAKYQTRMLCVLAVLVGKGANNIKGDLLFKQWDIDINNQVTKLETVEILEDMYKVSAEFIPSLDKTLQERADIKPYLDKVARGKEAGIQALAQAIVGEYEEIECSAWVAKFVAANIHTSALFRAYMSTKGEEQAGKTLGHAAS